MSDEQAAARQRRELARDKYRPEHVRLLLVAEAPTCALDRYFYYEDVKEQDSLFRYVCRGVLGTVSARERKAGDLEELRDAGVFMIDVSIDPIPDGAKIRLEKTWIDALPERCRAVKPDAIILIKSNVYDLAYEPLKQAGLNVINARMPFPGSGQQRKFEEAFALALKAAKFRM